MNVSGFQIGFRIKVPNDACVSMFCSIDREGCALERFAYLQDMKVTAAVEIFTCFFGRSSNRISKGKKVAPRLLFGTFDSDLKQTFKMKPKMF